MKRLDLSGSQFNGWTVISYAGNRGWNCRCACGNERIVNTQNLRSGQSTRCRACGPLNCGGKNRLPDGTAVLNDKINNCRNSANARKISWELTREQVQELFAGDCSYCGQAPSLVWERPKIGLRGRLVHNGIDRLDSSQGYIYANCVSCCKACNYMKRSMSVEAFRKHIFAVAEHFTLREIERECFAKAEAF